MTYVLQIVLLIGLLVLLLVCVGAGRGIYTGRRARGSFLLGFSLIALFLVGHALRLGRWTFPLVEWGMYTTVYEEPDFQSVRLTAVEGSRETEINPVACFPSLLHCAEGRLLPLVVRAKQGQLTPHGRAVYNQLIAALLDRHNQIHGTAAEVVRVELCQHSLLRESCLEETRHAVSLTRATGMAPAGNLKTATHWMAEESPHE